jgi:phage gp36-like protein
MSYCAKQDLIDRFGETELAQLTDRASAAAINDDVLNQAIADADSQIDRKLRGRYTVPVTPAPTELKPIACDLARFYLWGNGSSEVVETRYQAAMRELRDYATGINVLDIPDDSDDTPPQSVAVVASTEVFSDTTLDLMP